MNRIVLIGNGFDLAHGLKTSYRDFLDDYWAGWYEKLHNSKDCQLSDEFYKFSIMCGDQLSKGVEIGHWIYLLNIECSMHRTIEQMMSGTKHQPKSPKDISELCSVINEYREAEGSSDRINHQYKSHLFNQINDKVYLEKWMDIENEYYRLLKKIHLSHSSPDITQENSDKINKELTRLNEDLKTLANRLTDYLKIQEGEITEDTANEHIKRIIYELFNPIDISNGGQDLFLDNILLELSELPGGMSAGEIEEEMRSRQEYYVMKTEKEACREMIKEKLRKCELDDYLIPSRTLLLNFNYTKTAEKLYAKTSNRLYCEVINIHGELNNSDNPIIFGYGDEMDEHYKKIVDLNNNDYLHNIKSIRYLETDNYRKLLSYLDSAPYQIYIMGHSCGNSDRTLLNTLFEHKNCLSIKPFFHKKNDGSDDYMKIVQNISRNFKDATLMRDRVVNKTYCEPLPQNM